MAQTNPTYSCATGKAEQPIIDELIKKYGASNVTWPLVLIKDNQTIAYLYEKNIKNTINLETDKRPDIRARLLSYYLNYTKTLRESIPHNDMFKEFLKPKYSCSYEYIPTSPYSTVDLDYVWCNGTQYKGFEFTTFYVDFATHDIALKVIAKMNRRKSWQGENGAHALHRIVDSAADLGVDYYLVCANTISDQVGSPLKTNGNVCLFKLTHKQVDLLASGSPPEDSSFMTFADFLKWL